MMEEQIKMVRGETNAVRESVGRAREVVEGVNGDGEVDGRAEQDVDKRNVEIREKRVWEVLEKEVGRI